MEVILESLDKDDPFSIFKDADTFLTTGGEVCPGDQSSNEDTLLSALVTVFFDAIEEPAILRIPFIGRGKSKTKHEMSRKTTRGTENTNNNKKEKLYWEVHTNSRNEKKKQKKIESRR